MFQYKVIHNILYTNSMLHKMKKVESPYCPFCTNINQTVSHLFISCSFAPTFWSNFIEWYHSSTKKTLTLSKNEIMYGVLNNWSSCSTLNHLILIGKFFLYCKALNNIQFQFTDFIMFVQGKIEIGKYIAVQISNKYSTFVKKWSSFQYLM